MPTLEEKLYRSSYNQGKACLLSLWPSHLFTGVPNMAFEYEQILGIYIVNKSFVLEMNGNCLMLTSTVLLTNALTLYEIYCPSPKKTVFLGLFTRQCHHSRTV